MLGYRQVDGVKGAQILGEDKIAGPLQDRRGFERNERYRALGGRVQFEGAEKRLNR